MGEQAKGSGSPEEGWRGQQFSGTVAVWEGEKRVLMDGCDGWMHLMPLNCTLKNGKIMITTTAYEEKIEQTNFSQLWQFFAFFWDTVIFFFTFDCVA